jgi:hypothetical protein
VVLLVAFAFWQGRAANPLLPPRVVLDRNRGGAYLSMLIAVSGMARVLGRQALTGLALAHGYDTAFWWTAGLFAGGAVAGGILFRRGPLYQREAASGSPAGNPSLSSSLNPQTPPTPAATPGHLIDFT